MTTITIEREAVEVRKRARPEERRSTIVGWVLILLGLFVVFFFGFGVDAGLDATFNLSLQTNRFQELAWVVNARSLSITLGVLTVGLGAWRLTRRALDWKIGVFKK